MVLQRMSALVVLVAGFGLGLGLGFLRPVGEAPEAEAAERVTWRCIAPFAQQYYVQAYNSSTGKAVAAFTSFRQDGSQLGNKPIEIELAPRQSNGVGFSGPQPDGGGLAAVEVRGPSSLLVAGYVHDVHTPVTCHKKAG